MERKIGVNFIILCFLSVSFHSSSSRRHTYDKDETHHIKNTQVKKVQLHYPHVNHNSRHDKNLVANSNFLIKAHAGEAISISSHNLGYSSISIHPENIVYILTKELRQHEGKLLLIDQPNQRKSIRRFTQADVNTQKLVYIPPAQEYVPIEQVVTIELAVIRSPENTVLVSHQPFKIHIQPANQMEPQFRIVNPIIEVEQMKTTDIVKQYFEIVGTGNDNPDLKFVITVMPERGSLYLHCRNIPSLNLDGGVEFSLSENEDCLIQYEHNGDYNDGTSEDMFEVLASDGYFELENCVYLSIKSKEDNSSPFYKNKNTKDMIQFGSTLQIITVNENSSSVHVPVQRSGDLSSESQVQCYTVQHTATAGKDYVERRRNSIQSILIFPPGITLIDCEVVIIDDTVYESEEELVLMLELFRGSQKSLLGENIAMTMKITDFEDRPNIQFEKDEILVSEPKALGSGDATTSITVNVVRAGDLSQESRVRVLTCDNTALVYTDYEPLSELLVFTPGTEILPVQVRVKHRLTRTQMKIFSLILSAHELSGANLGEKSSLTIKVNPGVNVEAMKILPTKPIIVSLLQYDTMQTGTQYSNLSPGYPLICVNSCDSKHPQYSHTKIVCESAGINESNIAYTWEVAAPVSNKRTFSSFRTILDSMIYGNAHRKVLDSAFFAKKFRIRCSTTPLMGSINGKKMLGIPLKSNIVNIGHNALCPHGRNNNYQEENSFRAILRYVDSSDHDVKHLNTIHIHLEIPHSDGMIPLISTFPLSNPRYLLLDRRYTAQHSCSNLHNNSSFLANEISRSLVSDVGFIRPYQFSNALRGNETVLLYQHLNLNTCTWKFDAWFHMSQLVDSCGGKITSEFQVGDYGESYVTVNVPLYVTYMSARAPVEWTAVEHRTELEISFYYKSMLLQGGIKTQSELETNLQITKMSADEDGRLVFNFETIPQFPGYFVLSHHFMPGVRSEVVPPVGVYTNFTLDLIWSQSTWNRPKQLWRAISIYSLQDYSGEYKLKLIPCTVQSAQQYHRSNRKSCTPEVPIYIFIPVTFKQSSRPAPLVYNLSTYFTLTNDRSTFLTRPTTSQDMEDYSGIFLPGEEVYGRVLWHSSQHLHSAYVLTIQRLYLCACTEDFVPLFDPSGNLYNSGPQYGCLESTPKIKHSFLLLDKENPYSVDKYYNDVSLEAYFASDLPDYEHLDDYPGVDGFILKVDPLYKISSGYSWYLQVQYSIEAASSGRDKRSISETKSNIFQFQNGSDLKNLRLLKTTSVEFSLESKKEDNSTDLLVQTSSAIVVIGTLTILLLWLRKRCWREKKTEISCCNQRCNHVPLNSSMHSSFKFAKGHSLPAVTVWNDIRGTVTEV